MRNDPLEILENQEMIEKLRKAGYSDTIDKLFCDDDEVYTKKNRLNKSGACRVLGCKPKELDDMFIKWAEILKNEID